MNENKIALIHAFITASIGMFFLYLFFQRESLKLALSTLVYPLSYGIIRLFIKTGVKNIFLGFLEGGTFAVIGYSFLLVFLSLSYFGRTSLFEGDLIEIVWVIIIFFTFLVGGIAGAIITVEIRRIRR